MSAAVLRDNWCVITEAAPVSKRFPCESAFSLPRWLVVLVTPNKSDARWTEIAQAPEWRVQTCCNQSQIAGFKIKWFYQQIGFENDRWR